MLLIRCPWCGPREEIEFSYGGEAHIARPKDPDALSHAEWAAYVFMRTNPKGKYRERSVHAHGCRRWFNAVRDTVTHEFSGTFKPGDPPPGAKKAPTVTIKVSQRSKAKASEKQT